MAILSAPIGLALARDERTLPEQDGLWAYETKMDGWRGALFVEDGVIQSRNGNNLAPRFPEILTAAAALGDVVLDGEILALRRGRLDFASLASRATSRTTVGITIYYAAFDLLACGAEDVRRLSYSDRRARLIELFAEAVPPLQVIPSTADRDSALAWLDPEQGAVGIEGVCAKRLTSKYRAGRTDAWRKIRTKVVIDCLVAGVTGTLDSPDALVLGRCDSDGALRVLGLSVPLRPPDRALLIERLTSTQQPRLPLTGGMFARADRQPTDYQPVMPTVEVEIEADPLTPHGTFRHRPRVHRIRPQL